MRNARDFLGRPVDKRVDVCTPCCIEPLKPPKNHVPSAHLPPIRPNAKRSLTSGTYSPAIKPDELEAIVEANQFQDTELGQTIPPVPLGLSATEVDQVRQVIVRLASSYRQGPPATSVGSRVHKSASQRQFEAVLTAWPQELSLLEEDKGRLKQLPAAEQKKAQEEFDRKVHDTVGKYMEYLRVVQGTFLHRDTQPSESPSDTEDCKEEIDASSKAATFHLDPHDPEHPDLGELEDEAHGFSINSTEADESDIYSRMQTDNEEDTLGLRNSIPNIEPPTLVAWRGLSPLSSRDSVDETPMPARPRLLSLPAGSSSDGGDVGTNFHIAAKGLSLELAIPTVMHAHTPEADRSPMTHSTDLSDVDGGLPSSYTTSSFEGYKGRLPELDKDMVLWKDKIFSYRGYYSTVYKCRYEDQDVAIKVIQHTHALHSTRRASIFWGFSQSECSTRCRSLIGNPEYGGSLIIQISFHSLGS